MSDEEELRKLREKRLKELQQQQANQQQSQDQMRAMQQQQQQQYEAQKRAILGKILSSDARVRLTNIRMARPEFAQNLEMQLINLYKRGGFGNQLPMSDQQFKQILIKIQEGSKKRDREIKFR